MKYFSMIIVLGMLVLTCGCPREKSEGQGEDELNEVKAVINSLYQGFDKGDFEKAEDYVSCDYEFISAAGKRYDWATIRNQLENLGASGFSAEISNMKLKTIRNITWGSWDQLDVVTYGKKIIKENVVITGIFQKINGKWLWVHAHETKVEKEARLLDTVGSIPDI